MDNENENQINNHNNDEDGFEASQDQNGLENSNQQLTENDRMDDDLSDDNLNNNDETNEDQAETEIVIKKESYFWGLGKWRDLNDHSKLSYNF